MLKLLQLPWSYRSHDFDFYLAMFQSPNINHINTDLTLWLPLHSSLFERADSQPNQITTNVFSASVPKLQSTA